VLPGQVPSKRVASVRLSSGTWVRGAGMWKLLGRLTDQQKSLIEERLKYVDKELAKKGLRAGYRRVEAPADDMDGPAPSTSGPSRAVATSSASQGAQSYALPGSAHSSRNSSPTKPGWVPILPLLATVRPISPWASRCNPMPGGAAVVVCPACHASRRMWRCVQQHGYIAPHLSHARQRLDAPRHCLQPLLVTSAVVPTGVYATAA
jgi:hypothetical protein